MLGTSRGRGEGSLQRRALREAAERRADQVALQLSMLQSEHLKLQRTVELEKASAQAAKAREREAETAAADFEEHVAQRMRCE